MSSNKLKYNEHTSEYFKLTNLLKKNDLGLSQQKFKSMLHLLLQYTNYECWNYANSISDYSNPI